MNRKKEQAEFIYKVGLVLQPVLEIVKNPKQFDQIERARVRGKFDVEQQKLLNELNKFCKDEEGVEYRKEMHDIQTPLTTINNVVYKFIDKQPEIMGADIEIHRQRLIEAIAAVPISVSSMVYEANSPFSTYCRIKELCETTKTEFIYVDRYIDQSIFHRYLEQIPIQANITIVTWPRNKHRNTRNYDEFIDISRLFSIERTGKYALMVEPNFHDRWLRSDGNLFHLGGSIKDAASSTVFTVSKVDPTDQNIKVVENLLSTAIELFGPNNTTHP